MRIRSWVIGVVLAVGAGAPAPVVAQQVTPDRVAAIAQAIHDAERWNLGASSTRECGTAADGSAPRNCRNAFWARVVGVVVFGLAPYNATPDPGWCLKNGGNGRPQSDDVIVRCQSREFWDCIPNAGADGYRFECRKDHGPLPADQEVYAPPRPSGSGGGTGGGGTGGGGSSAVDLGPVLAAVAAVSAKVDAVAALALAARDAAQTAEAEARSAHARASDVQHVALPAFEAAIREAIRALCVAGRVPKAFGGSSAVQLCGPGVP